MYIHKLNSMVIKAQVVHTLIHINMIYAYIYIHILYVYVYILYVNARQLGGQGAGALPYMYALCVYLICMPYMYVYVYILYVNAK